MEDFKDEIKVFLSSPQSFELIEKEKPRKVCVRKKKKTISKKLLIRNILMEEDTSKLTARQKTLNERFKTTLQNLNDISLINSGIDLVEYNINNKNNLERYLKKAKCTVGHKEKKEGGMAIDSFIRLPKRKRKIEEDIILGQKYYNTLYEDSLRTTNPVRSGPLKIKLNRIESNEQFYTIRLPVVNESQLEETFYTLRLPVSENNEGPVDLCIKLPILHESEQKHNKKECKGESLNNEQIDQITRWVWIPTPTIPLIEQKKEKVCLEHPINLPPPSLFVPSLYGETLKVILALPFKEEIVIKSNLKDSLATSGDSNLLHIEKKDCKTVEFDHKEIRNCLVKFSLYIEIIQEYLKVHHCELVDSLLEHLKNILQRIVDSKCICGIENDLIIVLQLIEGCGVCVK